MNRVLVRWTLLTAAAGCGAPAFAPAFAEAPPDRQDHVTHLPPAVVTPDQDPWWPFDRGLRQIQAALPGLDTEGPRPRTRREKRLEALGLSGEGVQALPPEKQGQMIEFQQQLEQIKP